MLIKCQSPVDLFSGKTGGNNGIVGMPVKGRQIARDMVIPTNPQTTMQQAVRNYMSLASAAFQSLTAAEKAAWEAVGLLDDQTDSVGGKYNPSAIQEYQKVNMYRQLDGQAITDTAPSYAQWAAATSVAASSAGGNLTVAVTHSLGAAGGFFAIRVTPALASLVRNARENELRYLETSGLPNCIVSQAVSPQNVIMAMDAFTISPGDYIGIEVVTLSDGYFPGGILFDKSVLLT